jgi:hypothetical protein
VNKARLNALCVLLLMSSTAACTSGQKPNPAPTLIGTFPEVAVKCNEEREVYRNKSKAAITLTVQAADNCSSFDSTITLRLPDGSAQEEKIEDGTARAVSFTMPPGGFLLFQCNGDTGTGCRYSLSVP